MLTYLHAYLLAHMLTYLHAYLLAHLYLLTCLLTCSLAHLLTRLLTCSLTYLLACLLTYLLTYLLTCLLTTSATVYHAPAVQRRCPALSNAAVCPPPPSSAARCVRSPEPAVTHAATPATRVIADRVRSSFEKSAREDTWSCRLCPVARYVM